MSELSLQFLELIRKGVLGKIRGRWRIRVIKE